MCFARFGHGARLVALNEGSGVYIRTVEVAVIQW